MRQIYTEMKSINIEAAIHVKSSLALSRCSLSALPKWSHQQTSRPNDSSLRQTEQIPITQLVEEHFDGFCEHQNMASTPSWLYPLVINLLLLGALNY